MKILLYLATFIVATFMLSACADEMPDSLITEYFIGGDVWTRASIDELASNATDVVRAVVLDSRVELVNTLLADPDPNEEDPSRFYMLHTIYRLEVQEVFAGRAEVGGVIEFMQIGGRLGNRELNNERQLSFVIGDELIFFLHSFEAYGFGHLPMVLESSSQAVYRITTTDRRLDNALYNGVANTLQEHPWLADEILENFDPTNNLIITMGDLMRLTE